MNSEDFVSLLKEALAFKKTNREEIEPPKEIDEEAVKSFSNEKLCSIVASNRYLKINPKMEVLCMRELADRRSKGDSFPFENQINTYHKSFVPIEKFIPEAFDIIKNFKKL